MSGTAMSRSQEATGLRLFRSRSSPPGRPGQRWIGRRAEVERLWATAEGAPTVGPWSSRLSAAGSHLARAGIRSERSVPGRRRAGQGGHDHERRRSSQHQSGGQRGWHIRGPGPRRTDSPLGPWGLVDANHRVECRWLSDQLGYAAGYGAAPAMYRYGVGWLSLSSACHVG